MDTETKAYPPITNYYRRLRALFCGDPDITATLYYYERTIDITVSDYDKAEALYDLLPGTVTIGKTQITICVNGVHKDYSKAVDEDTVKLAFTGNPHFSRLEVKKQGGQKQRLFVLFKKEVIQFENDNFGSPYGVETTTAEALAKFVMTHSGTVISFTTEIK